MRFTTISAVLALLATAVAALPTTIDKNKFGGPVPYKHILPTVIIDRLPMISTQGLWYPTAGPRVTARRRTNDRHETTETKIL
jgi:hypothetical protein